MQLPLATLLIVSYALAGCSIGPHLRGAQVLGAARALDGGDWSSLNDQIGYGVSLEAGRTDRDNPWGADIGFYRSSDSTQIQGVYLRGQLTEVSAGMLYSFGDAVDTVRPFVGVGVSSVRAKLRAENFLAALNEDDRSVAGYLRAGVATELWDHFEIGTDVRILLGSHFSVPVFGSGSGDYIQAGLWVGYRF